MFSLGRKTYIQTGFGTAIPPSLPATLIGGLSPKSFPFSFTWPAPTDVSSVSFLSTKLGVEIHRGPGPSSYLGLLVLTRIFETVACPLLNSIRAAGTDPGWGLGGGWISIRCPELLTLQRMRPAAGLVSTRARVIQEAWGAGGEEAWTGRGLNVFIWGWQSYPPQRPWRQPHWCRWVRSGGHRAGGWRSPWGGALARGPLARSPPVRRLRVPLRGAQEEGAPLERSLGL